MEEGHGKDRNDFLRRHNIETYLIRQPEDSLLALPEDIMKEASSADRHASSASFNEASWSPELPFDNIVGKQNVSVLVSHVSACPPVRLSVRMRSGVTSSSSLRRCGVKAFSCRKVLEPSGPGWAGIQGSEPFSDP